MSYQLPRLLLLVTLIAAPLLAQDTRTVTEPVIPPFCSTLEAQLTATHGALPPCSNFARSNPSAIAFRAAAGSQFSWYVSGYRIAL